MANYRRGRSAEVVTRRKTEAVRAVLHRSLPTFRHYVESPISQISHAETVGLRARG